MAMSNEELLKASICYGSWYVLVRFLRDEVTARRVANDIAAVAAAIDPGDHITGVKVSHTGAGWTVDLAIQRTSGRQITHAISEALRRAVKLEDIADVVSGW
jgi:hypothetical protein